MGSSIGFEYRYRFWLDDEIIPQYSRYLTSWNMKFVFETRTNFIVKRRFADGDETIIDSESYATAAYEDCNEEYLRIWMGQRLKDYWMSDNEIQEFVHQASAFAKQRADDSRRGGVITIIVDADVCTVQQEGEPINATIDRAIRPKYLYPIHLCPVNQVSPQKEERKVVHPHLLVFLRDKLTTIRVKDIDEGLPFMEECPICLHNPTVGAQISLLQCRHAFHTYCIVRWLENNSSCPLCRQKAYDEFPG